MQGRYRQPLPMSVLLIVSDVDGETPAGSRLIRSLHAQTDAGWTLERDGNEPLATIQVSADSTLRPDAVAAIRQTFVDDAAIQAVIGDAIVDGERRLRPAWSPTFISRHAHELDLVAVRGAASSGSMAARLDALAALDPTAVAHLPRPLLERESAETVNDDASRAAARLVTEPRREPAADAVSFLVPTAGTRHPDGSRLVEHAIRAARGSGVSTVEVVLIVGDEFDGDAAELEADEVRVVRRPGPWNFSAAINTGLLAASHDTVVLLNDDIEMLTEGWLRPLIEHLRDRAVALVGTALLYPDHSLQHIGVVIDDALPIPRRSRPSKTMASKSSACRPGSDRLGRSLPSPPPARSGVGATCSRSVASTRPSRRTSTTSTCASSSNGRSGGSSSIRPHRCSTASRPVGCR